jgi:hypothetical protein
MDIMGKSNLCKKIESALHDINDGMGGLRFMLGALYSHFLLMPGNRASKAVLLDFFYTCHTVAI